MSWALWCATSTRRRLAGEKQDPDGDHVVANQGVTTSVRRLAQKIFWFHFSCDESRGADVLSPTIRIVTPVTLPTISACEG
jgi:hypothetical protein